MMFEPSRAMNHGGLFGYLTYDICQMCEQINVIHTLLYFLLSAYEASVAPQRLQTQ
jgi:hypothetical protein